MTFMHRSLRIQCYIPRPPTFFVFQLRAAKSGSGAQLQIPHESEFLTGQMEYSQSCEHLATECSMMKSKFVIWMWTPPHYVHFTSTWHHSQAFPCFVFQFAFSITHESKRAAKNKEGLGTLIMGMRRGMIRICFVCMYSSLQWWLKQWEWWRYLHRSRDVRVTMNGLDQTVKHVHTPFDTISGLLYHALNSVGHIHMQCAKVTTSDSNITALSFVKWMLLSSQSFELE